MVLFFIWFITLLQHQRPYLWNSRAGCKISDHQGIYMVHQLGDFHYLKYHSYRRNQMAQADIIFPIYITVAVFVILIGLTVIVLRNYVKVKLQREKEILKAVYDSIEQERTRVADDLHDSIGGNIAVVKLHNESINEQTSFDKIREYLKTNSEIIDSVIKEIRAISRNQSVKFISENGIMNELDYLKNKTASIVNMNIVYNDVKFEIFRTDFIVNLFRIIQELIQNALKHGKCHNINIVFSGDANNLSVQFSDDGIGFTGQLNGNGAGMKNIAGRVKIYNGSHKMTTAKDKGINHSMVFPVEAIAAL